MSYLIAGCGPGGIRCAEEIRRRDKTGEIVMISPEDSRPYSRITVPEYLTGEVEKENIYFKPESFFADNNIKLITGRTLVSLKPEKHIAVLDSGEELSYDKLLLATGSSPAMPPWANVNISGVNKLWGKADAESLAKKIHAGEKAIIIGGGLVGMQAARALSDHGLDVCVLEAADRLMFQQLDETAAEMLKKAAQNTGIRIETDVFVEEIREKDSRACGVTLRSGEKIEADHILICVGVRPNLGMLDGLDLDCQRGLETDLTMRTSIPDVFAAGDIVRTTVFGGESQEIRAIWINAVRQGTIAGANMAGGNEVFEGSRALNSIQLFGLAIASAGCISAAQGMTEEILSYPVSGTYCKLVMEGDVLRGALIAGDIQYAGPLFAKIGRPLNGFLGKSAEIVAGR